MEPTNETEIMQKSIVQFLSRSKTCRVWLEPHNGSNGFSYEAYPLIHAVRLAPLTDHVVIKVDGTKVVVEDYTYARMRGGYEPPLTVDILHPDSMITLGAFFGMSKEECEAQDLPARPIDPIAAMADLI